MTWNPFSRAKNTSADSSPDGPVEVESADTPSDSKGHATPKRKEAQARTVRPLIPDPKDRRRRMKEERARARQRQNSEYEAMKTGDVQHMPRAERLPIRVYIRAYVDARHNLGEYFIPVAIVCMIGSLALSPSFRLLGFALAMLMYVYLLVIIIDMVILWRGLKKKLLDKFGADQVKAVRAMSYSLSRAFQMRRFRMPKPATKGYGNWPK